MLLIDAIEIGTTPGTGIILPPRSVAALSGHEDLSPHEVDLRDVLALAELRGPLPACTTAIGLPARIELSEELTTVVQEGLDQLVATAVRLLAEWGHVCTPRVAAVDA